MEEASLCPIFWWHLYCVYTWDNANHILIHHSSTAVDNPKSIHIYLYPSLKY